MIKLTPRSRFIAISAGICFVVVYCIIWGVQAYRVKLLATNILQDISTEFRDENSDLVYTNVSLGGFPFSYKVSVEGLNFVGSDEESPFEIQAHDPVVFKASFLGRQLQIIPPKNLTFSGKKQGKEWPLSLVYEKQPKLVLDIRTDGFLPPLWRNFSWDDVENGEIGIGALAYHDAGFTLKDSQTDEIVASSKETSLEYRLKDTGDDQEKLYLKAHVHNANFDRITQTDKEPHHFGMVNVAVDLDFQGPQAIENNVPADSKLDIRKFSFTNALFGFDLSGQVRTASDGIFPFGNAQITLSNYATMVDYKTSPTYNLNLLYVPIPFLFILPKEAATMKLFLKNLAAETPNNGKDLKISLKREKSGDLYIGKHTLPEVMKLYHKTFQRRNVIQINTDSLHPGDSLGDDNAHMQSVSDKVDEQAAPASDSLPTEESGNDDPLPADDGSQDNAPDDNNGGQQP